MSPSRFRDVLSRWATGVALVTAPAAREELGLVVNSFTSVSLEPPLISFCALRSSRAWARMRWCPELVIHVLGPDHAALVRSGRRDAPADPVARLTVSLEAEHAAGDHTIAVCRVGGLEMDADRLPLVFWAGSFGTFVATRA